MKSSLGLYNRCHFRMIHVSTIDVIFQRKERRFVEHLPRTWMNVTSKREHFKRKDRLPVAAFFRGDLFVLGDIKLMEPTKLVPGLRLKIGGPDSKFFHQEKKPHGTKRWGTSYHPRVPGWCLNTPQKPCFSGTPSIHPFGARTMLRFVVCLTWNL